MTVMPPGPLYAGLSQDQYYANEVRAWVTAYGKACENAARLVSVAYARGYLQNWDGANLPISSEDLNACIDMANEIVTEYSDPNKSLVNRLRTDI